MNIQEEELVHWADATASRIIQEKGDRDSYVCASGITPSGVVHIGNFREIMSVDLVVRALKSRGKKVRFIFSWDDYDVFRKVPKNMPNEEMLAKHLRWPIVEVPDPWGRDESYARHHERDVETILPRVGISVEFIYQASRYKASIYAAEMKKALEKKETIRQLLDEHRTEALEADWWPVSVFCTSCHRDITSIEGWDGDWGLSYRCKCGHNETLDLRSTGAVKLFWRVDWPMRWAHEKVDFEPAGKDHHSEGGSFDTAKTVVKAVYDWDAPVSFRYDFIGIKGRGGKISSSSGEVVSLADVLEVYTPELTRYLFAGTRPNTEFSISFDLDVIKIYEDYDRCERIAFGLEEADAKRRAKERRIWELSQPGDLPSEMPYQVPFRHLCNVLQIHNGNIDAALDRLEGLTPAQRPRMRERALCAWNWITTFAPDDFKYHLRTPAEGPCRVSATAATVCGRLADLLESGQNLDEKTLGEAVYEYCGAAGLDTKQFFPEIYRVLVGRERGPRLANFILTVGAQTIVPLLRLAQAG